jgi:hypothetical protein
MAAEAKELTRLKKRCDDAYSRNAHRKRYTDDLYDYVIPWRQPTDEIGAGAPRTDRILDTTASTAAFRFAGRMQRDLTPPFQTWFELKAGPFVPEGPEKKQLSEDLVNISTVVAGMIHASNFDVSSHEMYMDLFGGQGAMLMLETERFPFLEYIAVPESEIALRSNGRGTTTSIFWKSKFPCGDLETMWRDVQVLDRELQRKIDKTPEEPVEIVQASEYNSAADNWTFTVYWCGGKTILHQSTTKLTPWLVPGFYRVPGQEKGIGPGLITMGANKTANKVREFALKSAAFALLGLWAYRNDGVFNPATSPLLPGAMWKVQSTGGAFGPSLSRLPVPENFDVSMFVLEDLRQEIKQGTFDDTLPPEGATVKSPTEIIERMKRLAADLAGAYGRLNRELVKPVVMYNIDVASRRLPNFPKINIDELLIRMEISSPIARGDQAASVEADVRWLEILAGLGGKELMLLTARVERIFTDIGMKLGVSELNIRSDTEKKQIQQAIAAMIVQQQQQQQAVAAPTAA